MPERAKESSGHKERFARTFRSLAIAETTLMPVGFVAVAALAHNQAPYNALPFWLLIALAIILGASLGLLASYASACLISWLFPKEPNRRKMQVALLSVAILALLTSWATWRDVPTNAQIDAIHHDPRFAAAIAEVNEKHMDAHLLAAAMTNGHAQVSRYAVFAIETAALFITLLFLFGVYLVIFRILSSLFRLEDPPV